MVLGVRAEVRARARARARARDTARVNLLLSTNSPPW